MLDSFTDAEQRPLSRPAESDMDLWGNCVCTQQHLLRLKSVVDRWHLLDAPVTVMHRPRCSQSQVNQVPRVASKIRCKSTTGVGSLQDRQVFEGRTHARACPSIAY